MRILDIGQCGFDGPRMEALWRQKLDATVDRCDTGTDAVKCLNHAHYDIVLVNRILAKDGSSGLEVIRNLLATGTKTPIMLVSDHPEAQDEAVALGAVRGFGKARLGQQSTLDLVQQTISKNAN